MGKIGGSAEKSKSQSSEKGTSSELLNSLSSGTTNTSGNSSFANSGFGSTKATFNPQGTSMLNSLTDKFSGDQSTVGRDNLNDIASNTEINPYVDTAIERSNEEASRMMGQNQAGIRAGNRGMGVNSNLYSQDDSASTFLSRMGGQNANTRVGAFENQANRRLGAAGQAAGLEQGDTGLMTSLIGMTKGQDSTSLNEGTSMEQMIADFIQNQQSTANKSYEQSGKSKGSKVGLSASGGFGGPPSP